MALAILMKKLGETEEIYKNLNFNEKKSIWTPRTLAIALQFFSEFFFKKFLKSLLSFIVLKSSLFLILFSQDLCKCECTFNFCMHICMSVLANHRKTPNIRNILSLLRRIVACKHSAGKDVLGRLSRNLNTFEELEAFCEQMKGDAFRYDLVSLSERVL